ncbi:hypothetical protein RchiOBHm_Chr5g0078441 [Rosa chinensis]|uniref:Uncharacterized protein n=1 Tax=Rosa chinensis TaxID=74649 RepID=A0A2P6QM88_ROSCH|nr:hypothetical protein RchiOBHm_Chr5g0078441 [Rosa chinensis]
MTRGSLILVFLLDVDLGFLELSLSFSLFQDGKFISFPSFIFFSGLYFWGLAFVLPSLVCIFLYYLYIKNKGTGGGLPECGRPFTFGFDGGTCSLNRLLPRS